MALQLPTYFISVDDDKRYQKRFLAVFVGYLAYRFLISYVSSVGLRQLFDIIAGPFFCYLCWTFYEYIQKAEWKFGWQIFWRVIAHLAWIQTIAAYVFVIYMINRTTAMCDDFMKHQPNAGNGSNSTIPSTSPSHHSNTPTAVPPPSAEDFGKMLACAAIDALKHTFGYVIFQIILSVAFLIGNIYEFIRFIRNKPSYNQLTDEEFDLASDEFELADAEELVIK